jgi:molybdopterin-guanine dinucleotide biosynthesis protein A
MSEITGCILAGGIGRRLGGIDKGLVDLGGRPLVAHVIERFAPQVDELLLSINRNHEVYRQYCPRVVDDSVGDAAGPLAGIAAAMHNATTPWLAVAPCDSPFLPVTLVAGLREAALRQHADIAVARTADGLQPVFALLATHLAPSLLEFLRTGGRKTDAWYARHALVEVDYENERPAFTNINTPDDLAAAADKIRQR